MFTPEGYFSWTDLEVAVVGWTHELLVESRLLSSFTDLDELSGYALDRRLRECLVDIGYSANDAEAVFAMDVLGLWLQANFMDTFDAILCSPAGIRMRCPPTLTAHGDAFDWWICPLGHAKFGNGDTYNYLRIFRECGFDVLDAKARFCTIDHLSGLVALKPNSVRLFENSSYGHGPDEKAVKLFIDQQVRPFLGWSICWNPSDIPDTQEEILGALGITSYLRSGSNLKNEVLNDGPENILECVFAAFPDGKGRSTWKNVEIKVGYSRRSIVRSLKKASRWHEWISND